MKKIKNIKQLQHEKRRMKQEQQDLEKKIKHNWSELKETLHPANMAKDAMNSFIRNKTEQHISEDSILKSTFNYGISLLAKKFSDKAAEKLSRVFKK